MATKSQELIDAEIAMLEQAKIKLLARLEARRELNMSSRPECKKCGSRSSYACDCPSGKPTYKRPKNVG